MVRKHLDEARSDLLPEIVRTFAERLMAAEVDVLCTPGTARSARSGRTVRMVSDPPGQMS